MSASSSDVELRASAGDSEAQILLARQLNAVGERQDAEAWLRRAVKAGNLDAMAALGEHLLGSPAPIAPDILKEARELILSAAQSGNGAASYLMARMTIANISQGKSWGAALNYLAHSAANGHAPAQIELAFLAGEPGVAEAIARGEAPPAQIWGRMYRAIDVAAWTSKVPPVESVSADPFIGVVRGFASPEICDWIIHWARPHLGPATSYDRDTGKSVANHNTASPELDFAVTSLIHRIGAITGVPINGKEGTGVLRYIPGQQFEPHFDFLDPGEPARAAEIRNTGQRIYTFLVSLSDEFDGGETDFPKAGYRYKGRKGDAVFFRNVTVNGEPDYKALHAGLPLTRGEKWAFVRLCTQIPAQA